MKPGDCKDMDNSGPLIQILQLRIEAPLFSQKHCLHNLSTLPGKARLQHPGEVPFHPVKQRLLPDLHSVKNAPLHIHTGFRHRPSGQLRLISHRPVIKCRIKLSGIGCRGEASKRSS